MVYPKTRWQVGHGLAPIWPAWEGAVPDVDCKLKGLVLAGGKGSRLRPLTATGAKQLVPVANKPVLFYAGAACRSRCSRVGIITGDTADQVMDAVGDGSAFGASIAYIPQPAPLGLAHAIITAEELAWRFALLYVPRRQLPRWRDCLLHAVPRRPCAAQILLRRVDDPSSQGRCPRS